MDKLGICNLACAEIAAQSIASLNESSMSADECNRQFDACFKELLEWSDWWFAKRRTVLAQVENDRPQEWAFAYALPANCATPLVIGSRPARMRNNVVFPQPLGPTTEMNSPARISRLTFVSALTISPDRDFKRFSRLPM